MDVLDLLSLVRCTVLTTQQPLVARTNLVYAEGQAAIGDVAALAADQTSLAHLFAVVPGAAHGRPTIPVEFTSGTWMKGK